MTSVTPGTQDHDWLLDFRLGSKGGVKLSNLSPERFDELLSDFLMSIDLRELRGFTALRSVNLAAYVGENESGRRKNHTLVDSLTIDPKAGITIRETDLSMHVLEISVGSLPVTRTFFNIQTGENTYDIEEALSWGEGKFFHNRGIIKLLCLRRPPQNQDPRKHLVLVTCYYSKCKAEDNHMVNTIEVSKVPVNKFRETFGEDNYAFMAYGLIHAVCQAYEKTSTELHAKLSEVDARLQKACTVRDAIAYL
ncbi:MAG: hypothetical protein MRY49_00295 [Candidatus Pacebacteria bacterium]|nr:hypothetical protein [Candidatus Paceibacterota bacterium]